MTVGRTEVPADRPLPARKEAGSATGLIPSAKGGVRDGARPADPAAKPRHGRARKTGRPGA